MNCVLGTNVTYSTVQTVLARGSCTDHELDELIAEVLRDNESDLELWDHVAQIEEEDEALLAEEFKSLALAHLKAAPQAFMGDAEQTVNCPICLKAGLERVDAKCMVCGYCNVQFEIGTGLDALRASLCALLEEHAVGCSQQARFGPTGLGMSSLVLRCQGCSFSECVPNVHVRRDNMCE